MIGGRRGALAAAAWLALTLSGCSLGLEPDVASRPLSAGPGGGQPAPALRGALVDGGTFDLAALRGRPVVIDFFATWCSPCHKQQPGLNSVATRYGARVAVVGVDLHESAAQVRGYEHSLGVPYPALIDSDGSLASAYNVPAPPVTLVVDASGRISQSFLGEVTADRIANVIDALLAH